MFFSGSHTIKKRPNLHLKYQVTVQERPILFRSTEFILNNFKVPNIPGRFESVQRDGPKTCSKMVHFILKHNQDTFLTNTQKKAKTRLKPSFKPHVQLFILGLMRLRTFYLRRCACCGDAHLAWRGIGMIIVMIYDWCCASYDYEWVLLATVIHLINR